MLYTRDLFSKFESEIHTKEATVITGMRRVGKTTALNYLFNLVQSDNKAIFDLENPLYRKIFEEENYDAVWHNLQAFNISNTQKAYLFLDEIQNLPEISRVVKYLYDHWQVKFFLTGSSSYYLRNLFPESLTGRKVIFEMYPLSFAEFLKFKQIPSRSCETNTLKEKAQNKNIVSYEKLIPYYKEYLQFGGFPAVVLEPSIERKKTLLLETFTSYFEKDAKNLADFKDMSKLRDLILLLVARTGSRLEILKLANSLAVSRETVYSYLSFLDQTYFISLLSRHSGSIDRQSAGSQKLFFCDSGIVNVLGQISQGQLFEQSVFQNFRQHSLTYFSKDGGNEIDFIVDGQTALEVKTTASQSDINKLEQRASSIAVSESYLVSLEYSHQDNVVVATDL